MEPKILSDEEKEKAIERWSKMSFEEKQEAISRSYYGIDKMLRRFVETGCYSAENPDQNRNWCSCGKPFCYECVADRIIRKLEPLIQQAKAEVAREITPIVDKLFEALDHADFSTGIEANGVDEGRVMASQHIGELYREYLSVKSKYGGQK